jgi:signal transduction histidine kinase
LASFYYSDKIRQEAMTAVQKERDSVQEKVQNATQILQEQQTRITSINTHLEGQNVQLQRAIKEAETAKQLQSDFLRNVSHEVRTPLSAVLGFSEILTELAADKDTRIQEFTNQISLAGGNLLGIFNNILTLSSLESSDIELNKQVTYLSLLLTQEHRAMQAQATQKGLTFTCDWSLECEEPILLDMVHFRQVLQHLLSNAIKFTEYGSVYMRCDILPRSSLADSEKYIRLTVRDTGIGIESDYQAKLFLPFQQQDASKNRRYGGLGLGLAITKRLVEAMAGTIRCESVVGQGSTFIVELPKIIE